MTIKWCYCPGCRQGYYGHPDHHVDCLVLPMTPLEEGEEPSRENMPGEEHFCPVCHVNYYGEEDHHEGCLGRPSSEDA
jgi:hypothetical protein